MRGPLGPALQQEVLDHWAERTLLHGDQARRRLGGVVAIARDGAGRVVGVSTVDDVTLPLVDGRRFYLHRASAGEEIGAGLRQVAFDLLDEDTDPAADLPGGFCELVGDADARSPLVDAGGLLHAGYLRSGSRVQLRWFRRSWSSVGDAELEPGYAIGPYDPVGPIPPERITELWTDEAGLDAAEAARRIGEVVLVATDPAGGLAGVATAFPKRNEQLRVDLWYFRTFVTERHRMNNLAVQLTLRLGAALEAGSVDPGPFAPVGVLTPVQNEGLKRHLPGGLWSTTNLAFIGSNARGDHVRVRYFPGARLP